MTEKDLEYKELFLQEEIKQHKKEYETKSRNKLMSFEEFIQNKS